MYGGSLEFHLTRLHKFDENCIKFFAAQISSAIIYLHINHSIRLYAKINLIT
jgi:hypothetical protein